eukprot:335460_1
MDGYLLECALHYIPNATYQREHLILNNKPFYQFYRKQRHQDILNILYKFNLFDNPNNYYTEGCIKLIADILLQYDDMDLNIWQQAYYTYCAYLVRDMKSNSIRNIYAWHKYGNIECILFLCYSLILFFKSSDHLIAKIVVISLIIVLLLHLKQGRDLILLRLKQFNFMRGHIDNPFDWKLNIIDYQIRHTGFVIPYYRYRIEKKNFGYAFMLSFEPLNIPSTMKIVSRKFKCSIHDRMRFKLNIIVCMFYHNILMAVLWLLSNLYNNSIYDTIIWLLFMLLECYILMQMYKLNPIKSIAKSDPPIYFYHFNKIWICICWLSHVAYFALLCDIKVTLPYQKVLIIGPFIWYFVIERGIKRCYDSCQIFSFHLRLYLFVIFIVDILYLRYCDVVCFKLLCWWLIYIGTKMYWHFAITSQAKIWRTSTLYSSLKIVLSYICLPLWWNSSMVTDCLNEL